MVELELLTATVELELLTAVGWPFFWQALGIVAAEAAVAAARAKARKCMVVQ